MANIDRFLQRNKDFAATGAHEGASIIARHHHTQCGTHFLADDKFRRGFADLTPQSVAE